MHRGFEWIQYVQLGMLLMDAIWLMHIPVCVYKSAKRLRLGVSSSAHSTKIWRTERTPPHLVQVGYGVPFKRCPCVPCVCPFNDKEQLVRICVVFRLCVCLCVV